jgi:hypothetical protein
MFKLFVKDEKFRIYFEVMFTANLIWYISERYPFKTFLNNEK